MSDVHKTPGWYRISRKRKALGKARNESCSFCGGEVDYENKNRSPFSATVDHPIPVALGGDPLPEDIEELTIAHFRCNASAGQKVGQKMGRNKRDHERDPKVSSPVALEKVREKVDPGWAALRDTADACPWEGPGAPPRLLSPEHPDATGTYGPKFVEWIGERRAGAGLPPLRYFQELLLHRLLEHDEDGDLVWRRAVVTLGRQLGKSTLIAEYALARCVLGPELWGDSQHVVHISRVVRQSYQIQKQSWEWAEERGCTVSRRMDSSQVIWPEGSAWTTNSMRGVIGSTSDAIMLDEAFAADRELFNASAVPSTASRRSAQILMFSSPAADATDLVPKSRLQAAKTGSGVFIAEWSVDPGVHQNDLTPALVTAASPYTDKAREISLADAYENSSRSEFSLQWAARWSEGDGVVSYSGWPLGIGECETNRAHKIPLGLVAAVESSPDRQRWGVAVYERESGRLWTREFEHQRDVERFLRDEAKPSVVLLGVTLMQVVKVGRIPTVPYGGREMPAATAAFQDAVSRKVVVHDHNPALLKQAAAARTKNLEVGIVLSAKESAHQIHVLKAAAWAHHHALTAKPRQSWKAVS